MESIHKNIVTSKKRLKEEGILVCLSGAASNDRVIRAGASMAKAFQLKFIALYVETSSHMNKSPISKDMILRNMKLVESLGGVVVTVYGEDIPLQIGEYAAASGINKIIIGRSRQVTRFSKKKTFADYLLQNNSELELYIIPDTKEEYDKSARPIQLPNITKDDILKFLLIIISTSLISVLFHIAGFSDATIITVYIMGVLFTSLWTNGRVYGVVSSLLNVIIFNLLFTEPKFTLRAYESGYPVTFLVMLLASLITSSLALKVKLQARQVAKKAYRTEILLETSRKLQKLEDVHEILEATAYQIHKLMNTSTIFYEGKGEKLLLGGLIHKEGNDVDKVKYVDNVEEVDKVKDVNKIDNKDVLARYISDYEINTALWVYSNNKMAGASTEIHSDSKLYYVSIRGMENRSLGVIGIEVSDELMDLYVKNLMFAILEESGVIIERHLLNVEKKEIELTARQEALRANVLRSISHDLRTPLTSISGNAGILLNHEEELSKEKRKELYVNICDDSIWLNQVIENLLAITKMDNGSLSIHQEAELIEDVIIEALKHIDRKSIEHHITYTVEDEYLMARMDVRLIVQVIINLVNNAIKYSSKGSSIEIHAISEGEYIKISVCDNGEGIGDEEKVKLFNMFYTVNNSIGDSRRGLGLGLFLCNSIITAHGGRIWVEDNSPHGSKFHFTLVKSEVTIRE